MVMPSDPGPVVQRALLTSELQALRQKKGATQDQVAAALDWSPSKLIRIEGGTVGVSTTDLHALLRYYGLDDDDPNVARLTEIARQARQRGWWSLYKNEVRPAYLEFLGYEAGASTIRNCQPLVIPGLLQTEAYANSLTVEFLPDREQRDIVVEIRLQRQERILERENPPELHVILDEAALRRRVGGQVDPLIMPDQLRHLLDMMQRPNITVEIIPFSKGAHFGMIGQFTILEFAGIGLGDVLYQENAGAGNSIVAVRGHQVTEYKIAFENVRQLAIPHEESAAFIQEVIASMT